MKNNIAYYQHQADSHSHWQFKVLRRQYGWAGEGKFWALCNLIADEENCVLTFKTPAKERGIAADLDFTPAELKEFITYLLDDCMLLIEKDGGITTEEIIEAFEQVSEKRAFDRQRKLKGLKKEDVSIGKEEHSVVESKNSVRKVAVSTVENEESIESKVKKSKLKKRKEKEIKEEKIKEDEKTENEQTAVKSAETAKYPSILEKGIDGYKAFQQWIIEHTPLVAAMEQPITEKEYDGIAIHYIQDPASIQKILTSMQNNPEELKQHQSAFYTMLGWKVKDEKT